MSSAGRNQKNIRGFWLDIKLDSSSKRIGILGAPAAERYDAEKYCGDRHMDSGRICIEGKDRV